MEKVLEAAYQKHPERFVKGRPKAGSVPKAVWINPPVEKKEETALLIPVANCPDPTLSFCREFFGWYNDEHYHSGIGLLTPASLHYGEAQRIIEERERVLEDAYRKHPERFVKGRPKAGSVPEAVWINPPVEKKEETALLIPEVNCPERLEITPPQNEYGNGLTDMKIEEIEGLQMAGTLH